jgi:hypothetical protein
VDTEVLRDLFEIFVFIEGLCEIWLGHLPPVSFAYVFVSVRIFVRFPYIVIYIARTFDKNNDVSPGTKLDGFLDLLTSRRPIRALASGPYPHRERTSA